MERHALHVLTDDELLRRLTDLLRQSRGTEADLVAHIAEVDARKLYAREACSSMFAYCTEILHLSEAEAYLRIAAGRASRAHPVLLEMLTDGRLHLSAIGKLAPHLTSDHATSLLARAAHKTKQQVLELIAEVAPRPDVSVSLTMRRLPLKGLSEQVRPASPGDGPLPSLADPQQLSSALAPSQEALLEERTQGQLRPDQVAAQRVEGGAVLEPLSPGRYRIQFTASATFKDKLKRLQALMPSGQSDMAALIEAAVTEKLERLEATRFAQTRAPRKSLRETKMAPTTRHIPAAVRRAVYERDGSRCAFVDQRGRRCSERRQLELHHRYPFGQGGDHSPRNVAMLCRAHNRLMAEQDYGPTSLARNRGSKAATRQTWQRPPRTEQ